MDDYHSLNLLYDLDRRLHLHLCRTFLYESLRLSCKQRRLSENQRKEIAFRPNYTVNGLAWCAPYSANREALGYFFGIAVVTLRYPLFVHMSSALEIPTVANPSIPS